jgi:hypothetical protein
MINPFMQMLANPFGDPRRERVWKELWEDPKYLKIHERKDRLFKDWNFWDARALRSPEYRDKADKAHRSYKRALKRMYAYENAALEKAGLTP